MRAAKLCFVAVCAVLIAAFILPPPAQAGFSILPKKPFGGKILVVIPNTPVLPIPVPGTPNPCYEPNTYLLFVGLKIYVLPQTVRVINGINPPLPGAWSLGLAEGITNACPTITLMGVSKLF